MTGMARIDTIAAYLTNQLEAVDARQGHVGNDERGDVGGNESECFLTVAGLHDVEHLAEVLGVHLPCFCVVFDEEKKRSCICRRHSA